jgi:transposase
MGYFGLDWIMEDDRLRRHALSDAEWAQLEPLLPRHPRQGHRWNDHRLVIDGVLHRVRAGHLRRRGIKATIPEPADRKAGRLRRGRKGGRPPAFDPAAYKQRNTVERAFSKLRQSRAVATRYDKRDFVYRGTVDVASIRIWLHDPAR